LRLDRRPINDRLEAAVARRRAIVGDTVAHMAQVIQVLGAVLIIAAREALSAVRSPSDVQV
jgi:hypothetical protein